MGLCREAVRMRSIGIVSAGELQRCSFRLSLFPRPDDGDDRVQDPHEKANCTACLTNTGRR